MDFDTASFFRQKTTSIDMICTLYFFSTKSVIICYSIVNRYNKLYSGGNRNGIKTTDGRVTIGEYNNWKNKGKKSEE